MMRCVSVVIATHNRSALLARTMDALAGQRWPSDRLEIVVADNRSTDDTRAVVEAAAVSDHACRVHYLYVPEPGKSFAVNAALRIATGDLLLFIDDDVVPEPLWIDRMTAAIVETGADFAAGRILPLWETAPPPWMSPALYGVLAVPDNGSVRIPITANGGILPIGANLALRRTVVDRIGGLRSDLGKLDGTLRTGEDHEFFLRMLHAGYRGVYEPDAIVHHWVPRERLERGYFRRWLHQNGQDVAKVERAFAPSAVRLLGVPRYLWRQAAADTAAAIRAALVFDDRRRVASTLRMIWFAGYVRETVTARLKGSRSFLPTKASFDRANAFSDRSNTHPLPTGSASLSGGRSSV